MNLIVLGPLRIKIFDRENVDANDYWDGNWLTARAYFSNENMDVPNASASGSIIHLSEMKSFLQELSRMNRTRSGRAVLECMEPNLYVELSIPELKTCVQGLAKIDPDEITEDTEQCNFVLDPDDINSTIASISEVLAQFPLKGSSSY